MHSHRHIHTHEQLIHSRMHTHLHILTHISTFMHMHTHAHNHTHTYTCIHTQYVLFSVKFLSLSKVILRFIYFVMCINNSLFLVLNRIPFSVSTSTKLCYTLLNCWGVEEFLNCRYCEEFNFVAQGIRTLNMFLLKK